MKRDRLNQSAVLAAMLAPTVLILSVGISIFLPRRGPTGPQPALAAAPRDLPSPELPIFPAEPAETLAARQRMIDEDLAAHGIVEPRVLTAMGRVPRQLFLPFAVREFAYEDRALPSGFGPLCPPYLVALLAQTAEVPPNARVLVAGTGVSYQAAVQAEFSRTVCALEDAVPLADEAGRRFADLGYKHVAVRAGDVANGWPDKAPFDTIIVASYVEHAAEALIEQLAAPGRLIAPADPRWQQVLVLQKQADGTLRRSFVTPLGAAMHGLEP